jgi:murein DD-endopeptidase MepM/ murein hydrolase activator NlpD
MNDNRKIGINFLKDIFFKLVLFISIVFAIFIVFQISITRKNPAVVSYVPITTMPIYLPDVLLNDVEVRSKYLASRVKDTNFFVYSVKRSDNLWILAKKYGYSVHTLIGTNPQLKSYEIDINQKILIPSSAGSLHLIQKDDTWVKIAERYNIDDKILRLKNFGVSKLVPMEYIFVPEKRPIVDLMNKDMQTKYKEHSLFQSPLYGRYSSRFGMRKHPVTGKISFHGGLDIAVSSGTWVGAAASGVVILASHNVGHYGTAVFIDHKNGYVTHYGHLSYIKVKVGQKVKKGQLIAKSGATGRVTGPHLHFTIKKNNKALDPARFIW